jgi:GT2 family glycosyltransferase
MRAAVLVLAYRSIETIEAAVRSALHQRYDDEVVVLVREQGGDEAELALLHRIAAEAPALTVTSGPNLGYAGGHDELLRSTDAEVVVLLNADAWMAPDLVAVAAARLAADERCGAVQPKVLRPDRVTVDSTGIEVRPSRRALTRVEDVAGEVFGVDGAVAVYRRAALDDAAVDGEVLPRSFVAYKEDVDLAWRLRWRGWSARYEPAALAWHDRNVREVARRRMPPVARRLGWANHRLMQRRVEPLRELGRDRWAWLGREVVTWLLLLTRPSDVVPCVRHLAAGWEAAGRAGRVVRARRVPGADPRRYITRR